MKYLIGLFTFPALIGVLVLFHTLIDTKYKDGIEITNRIARLELMWLAISRPSMFCEYEKFRHICLNIKENLK